MNCPLEWRSFDVGGRNVEVASVDVQERPALALFQDGQNREAWRLDAALHTLRNTVVIAIPYNGEGRIARSLGYPGSRIRVVRDPHGRHSWAGRIRGALEFVLPAQHSAAPC